jgi:DNA-binding NarL/FixJ family response regulator
MLPTSESRAHGPRVLLVDDSNEYRYGLQMRLRQFSNEIEIVGEAGSAEETRRKLTELNVDLVLLDLHLPSRRWAKPAAEHGLETLRFIRRLPSAPKVLVLSSFKDQADDLFGALKAGADGCMQKDDMNPDELVTAIQRVVAGQAIYSSNVAEMMRSAFLRAHEVSRAGGTPLTSSEDDVLRDLGQGKTVEQIDQDRELDPGTAGSVATRLLDRLRAID